MRTVTEPSGSLNKVRAFVAHTLQAAGRGAAHHRGALSVVALLTASATASAAPAELLEEIVVTGSQIPTTAGQTAVPVITVTGADLAKAGDATNALEALRKVIPGFEGRSNTGLSNANNNNQNTAGGSQLQLRDLPTLVLINGRRVAISGVAAINGKNFVDVSQIPIAAIDRVEVLPDGASAIYGSDAVGGVVNFILKTDYEGVSVGVRDGQATDYGERSAYATGGIQIGDANIVSTGSYTHSDPLYQSQRDFSSPFLGHVTATTLPGIVSGGGVTYRLNPALSSPSQQNPTGANATAASLAALVANGTYQPTTAAAVSNSFDLSPYQTLLLRQDIGSFATTFKAPILEDRLEAFGDVMVSQGKSWTQWQPVSSTVTEPAGAPYNPLTTALPGVSFADLNKPHYFQNTEYTAHVTAGLKGEIAQDWNWESAALYSQDDLRQQQSNLIYKPNLAAAIAGGYNSSGVATPGGAYSQVLSGYSPSGALVLQPALDPFATSAGLNPASLANLYGGEDIHTVSRLESWDGKVTGGIVPLPAGKLETAVGVAVRRESLSGHTDPNGRVTDPVTGSYFGNDQEWIGGTFANPFDKSRTITSEFAEFRVPITGPGWNVPAVRAFDLSAAIRHEHYSDAGNSTVPKFGFRWQPISDQLTFRGDYAKSFLAPTLYSEAGPTDTRTSNGPLSAAFGANYTGLTFQAEDGNNPQLKPATSISRTIGFVIKPTVIPNLTLTADYSDITLQQFQGGAGFNNIASSVNTLGSASPFFNSLAVGAFPDQGGKDPFTTPGALLAYLTGANGKGSPTQAANLYMVDFFRNLAQLHEESWTIAANYNIPTERIGTFSLGTNGTLLNSFKFTPGIAGQPTIQNAGTSNTESVFGGTLPKQRFYSTIDWTYADIELTLANTYVSGVKDTGASGTLAPIPVASYTTFDARAAYTRHVDRLAVQTVKIAVGVNNLANRMPPLDPRVFTDNNADVSTYSPIGRLVYATVTVTF
jgi:iron complex outermembrane recepter protein